MIDFDVKRRLTKLAKHFRRGDPAHPVFFKGRPLERLTQGKREDIREIGVYHGGKSICVNAYTGQLDPRGEKHKIGFSVKTDPSKHEAIKKAVINQLLELWDETYARKKTNTQASPEGIAARIHEVLVDLKAEGGGGATYRGYEVDGLAFVRLLGPRRESWPPTKFKPDQVAQICKRRLLEVDPETETPKKICRNLRYVLKRLEEFGFDPQCVRAVQAPRRHPGNGLGTKYSIDYPFLTHELKVIIERLPRATNIVQGIVLASMCGAMHGTETVTLTWKKLREAVEAAVSHRRVKNHWLLALVISPAFRAWMERQPHSEDDEYVFKELFKREQLAKPNKGSMADKREAANAAEVLAQKMFDDYLRKTCGLTREGISLRSFKYYNASALIVMGHQPLLVRKFSGHANDVNLERYLTGIQRALWRMATDLWEHYEAVAAGIEEPVILTHRAVVRHLNAEMKRHAAEFTQEMNLLRAENSRLTAEVRQLPELLVKTLLAQAALCVEPDGTAVLRLPLNGTSRTIDPRQLLLPSLQTNGQAIFAGNGHGAN